MNTIPCTCSQREFFEALHAQAEAYSDQPFLVYLDGTLVHDNAPPNFKLWCRATGLIPIVTGWVDEADGTYVIHWSARLPLSLSIAFACFTFFALAVIATNAWVPGLVMLLIIGTFVIIMKQCGQHSQQKIETVLRECAATKSSVTH
ncbi:MAG: hypothetical protein WCT04_10135 [Planctomycetota bacterium]